MKNSNAHSNSVLRSAFVPLIILLTGPTVFFCPYFLFCRTGPWELACSGNWGQSIARVVILARPPQSIDFQSTAKAFSFSSCSTGRKKERKSLSRALLLFAFSRPASQLNQDFHKLSRQYKPFSRLPPPIWRLLTYIVRAFLTHSCLPPGCLVFFTPSVRAACYSLSLEYEERPGAYLLPSASSPSHLLCLAAGNLNVKAFLPSL